MQEGALARKVTVLYGSKSLDWTDYHKLFYIILGAIDLLELPTAYNLGGVIQQHDARHDAFVFVQELRGDTMEPLPTE